jgi:hypothetical protein
MFIVDIKVCRRIQNDLQDDATNSGGITMRSGFINGIQRHYSPRLVGVTRLASEAAMIISDEISPEQKRWVHVETPAVRHRETHRSPRRAAK